MRNFIRIYCIIFGLIFSYSCQTQFLKRADIRSPIGSFKSPNSYEVLELKADCTFVWHNEPKGGMNLSSRECSYRSNGNWKFAWQNVLELTSYNVLDDMHWFQYKTEEKPWGSPDSVYLEVIPAEPNLAVRFYWLIDGVKIISDGKGKVAKKDLNLRNKTYQISSFYLIVLRDNTKAESGYGASSYDVFYKSFDVEFNNLITVHLPDLNTCKLYLKPIDHEYLLIQNENELKWNGRTWKRISPQDTVRTK